MAAVVGPNGLEIEVEDTIAAGLVRSGHVRYAQPCKAAEPPAPVDEDVADDSESEADESRAAEETSGDRPPQSAHKAEWVDYAVTELGLSRSDAEARTKQDLIELADGE